MNESSNATVWPKSGYPLYVVSNYLKWARHLEPIVLYFYRVFPFIGSFRIISYDDGLYDGLMSK